MQLFPEISSYFEALMYLQYRFSTQRAVDRINKVMTESAKTQMPHCAYFQKIAELEAELDSHIGFEDLIRYYFMPLKTKETQPSLVLSPGAMLLTLPDDLDYDCDYNSILNFYEHASEEEKLLHFCDVYMFSSEHHNAGKCKSISDFMPIIDDILVENEDKWKLIDVVANPIKHLLKLQPLISEIVSCIEKRKSDFSPLIESFFSETKPLVDSGRLLEQLGIELHSDVADNTVFYPSIFIFNGLFIRESNNTPQMFLGLFFIPLMMARQKNTDIKGHLEFLKILSDSTRLRALYALCNKDSYGQELAEKIGGTRNAMYYHLDKLFGFGLVNRKETEYRTLYTMNKKNVYDKLTALRDFLVDGWKPSD